jgi:oxygen-independent coproporphyrinogen-3 oxidase
MELELEKDFFEGQSIQTIYFGGGTPSIVDVEGLAKLLQLIKRNYAVEENAEITLEANPDDMTFGNLEHWKAMGINRLSVGVQSFRDEDLEWMNRSHRAKQAIEALELAAKVGMQNLNLDLIYALPGLTDEEWKNHLRTAFSLGITHLSSYSLTVEEKTRLNHLIKKGEMPEEDEEQSARQFEVLMEEASKAGFEHYEISNFAKPGSRSQHNSNYWKREAYLGIGPSAHSFKANKRWWNLSSNAGYIQSMAQGKPHREEEILSKKDIANEVIMTGLRTAEGFQLRQIQELNLPTFEVWNKQLEDELSKGKLIHQAGRIQLSHEGKFLADELASNLFFI